jgi:pimeloyl-ACP methyl ester carboxylesterase
VSGLAVKQADEASTDVAEPDQAQIEGADKFPPGWFSMPAVILNSDKPRSLAAMESVPVQTTPVKREFLAISGKRLETLLIEARDERSPTIVMLHEGLGSIALWKDFSQRLAERTGCAVLVYSRYGHGSSDRLLEKRPVNFMHHEGQVVLPELLNAFNIKRPILLGHSDGGSIALIYAGTFPESPRALILEAPHVFVEDLSVESIAAAKVNFQTTDFREKLAKYHAHVDETFWGWNAIWLDPAFRSWNIKEYLESIRCPILCIQGEQDEYGTPAQVRAIGSRAPGTEIVMLADCKHSPHRDQREKTLEAVERFVKKVVSGQLSVHN